MAPKNTLGTPPRLSSDPTTALNEIQSYLQDIYNTLVLANQYLPRGETSDFGRALVAASDAAAARQRLIAMQAPSAADYQTFGGGGANVAAVLPEGGEWVWHLFRFNAPAGTVVNVLAGRSAGGAIVAPANASLMYFGVCWRV